VEAEVRFDGPDEVSPVRTDAGGAARAELRPGAWRVLASTEELGVRSAEVVVEPGQEGASVELSLAARKVDMTAARVVIREAVHFDFDRATLRPESGPILDEVAATVLAHPGIVRVEVQGHTDDRGDVAYNQRLSQLRAEAVVRALATRGVAPERLVAQGYGPTRPVADNDSDAGRAANRRVQFEILEATGPDSHL
jgi:outer membrane protein OmpA-like peptidoglycan-associated protein